MLDIGWDVSSRTIDNYKEIIEKFKPKPLFYFPYLRRVLTDMYKREQPQYPMTIKIPKVSSELMRGDFEPAYTITLKEPPLMTLGEGDPIPMWFENSSNQAWLRFGFRNLDARNLSDEQLSQEYIHGFLGGSSGHGKSVTMNALIASLCFEYGPWEIELHLSDAKIVEFKKYGINHRIPHIKSIAATEDADFVISVLQNAFNEMNARGKFFTLAGASNLSSFRKNTGLALPRIIIIMDEVESTFRLAGKKASKIGELIDGFARLGRAAGVHILMATQNLSSDIPKSALGQIRNRMSLGAIPSVSEAILGNVGAAENIGRIGRLIVNTAVLNGGNTVKGNVKYQTPFLSDKEFLIEMEFLENMGKTVGYQPKMSFYDEEDMKVVETFDTYIDNAFERMKSDNELSPKGDIILGLPAFVIKDKDQLLKIKLDGKDIENIYISSVVDDKIKAHIHNISKSLSNTYRVMSLSTSEEFFDYTYSTNKYSQLLIRDADDKKLLGILTSVKKRLLILEIENLSSLIEVKQEGIESVIKSENLPPELANNSLMCKRIAAWKRVMEDASYKNLWDACKGQLGTAKQLYDEYVKAKAVIEPLKSDMFPKIAIFIGDISKINGWGRTPKSNLINNLKLALQDACRVNIYFVVYGKSIEGITDIITGLRYVIFDTADKREWSRNKIEELSNVSSKLAVLCDKNDFNEPYKKFKCTLLEEPT